MHLACLMEVLSIIFAYISSIGLQLSPISEWSSTTLLPAMSRVKALFRREPNFFSLSSSSLFCSATFSSAEVQLVASTAKKSLSSSSTCVRWALRKEREPYKRL